VILREREIAASTENVRVFIWKAFTEWKPVLEGMFGDVLIPEVEAEARKANVKYGDDQDAFEELTGCSIDSMVTPDKISEFRQTYSHVRVYHGCRPEDISSYKEKGLLVRDKSVQIERFRKNFLTGKFPELTEEMLQHSIEKLQPNTDKDEEWEVVFDDRILTEYCGQYHEYGSEYLGNLVSNLPIENKEPYRSELRKSGKPTTLKINLPNTSDYLSDSTIEVIIRDMLAGWLWCVANSETEAHTWWLDLSHEKPLPPEHICGHKVYNEETGEYEENSEIEEKHENQRQLTEEEKVEAMRLAKIALKTGQISTPPQNPE